jgi:filamentous hemagglutinin family protein
VVQGQAGIIKDGKLTYIEQKTERAVIDWKAFGIEAAERVHFQQPSATSSALNRVTGDQVSVILGTLTANGQVVLVNPNGIVFGPGSRVDVGSLIASTSNLSNANFMAGRLVFDEPGRPGAGIVQSGTMTAAEGGLVALVAPHVRNDGLIQARLGKVALGSGDTFTIDLFGDQLINLALSDRHVGQLVDADGKPVKALINQAGTIDVAGGKAVLATAGLAKAVVDDVINMSGTIKADAVGVRNGQIVLLGRGGQVDVTGQLSATGAASGETGGTIQVLGDRISLGSTSHLDASAVAGGGVVLVGGDYQGTGDVYRAEHTAVEAGARIDASAREQGDGGKVVVWSDGDTTYRGTITARGADAGGDGGIVEVSGKKTLAFEGLVDAGAKNGKGGELLLDPEYTVIGAVEADSINRTLRTGTSTVVTSSTDIEVDSPIDGRGGTAGGGLTLDAMRNITLNHDIITADGAVVIWARNGGVEMREHALPLDPSTGRKTPLVYAGNAPITITAGGNAVLYELITKDVVTVSSSHGSVFFKANLGYYPGMLLKGLNVQAMSSDASSPGEVAFADVMIDESKIAQGGRVVVDTYRNLRIFPAGPTQGTPGLKAAMAKNAVRLNSTLLGQDLQKNLLYLINTTRYFKGPGADGKWSTLLGNDVDAAQPGIVPPSPALSLPKIVELLPIVPEANTAGEDRGNNLVLAALNLTNSQISTSADSSGGGGLVENEGQGVARSADLGRGSDRNGASDIFDRDSHVVEGPVCDSGGSGAHSYFGHSAFGVAFSVACQ